MWQLLFQDSLYCFETGSLLQYCVTIVNKLVYSQLTLTCSHATLVACILLIVDYPTANKCTDAEPVGQLRCFCFFKIKIVRSPNSEPNRCFESFSFFYKKSKSINNVCLASLLTSTFNNSKSYFTMFYMTNVHISAYQSW